VQRVEYVLFARASLPRPPLLAPPRSGYIADVPLPPAARTARWSSPRAGVVLGARPRCRVTPADPFHRLRSTPYLRMALPNVTAHPRIVFDCNASAFVSLEREHRTHEMASYLEHVANFARLSESAFTSDRQLDCMRWGMLPSEATAVLAAARAVSITHFFESGVSHGQSTEFFCRSFERGLWHPRVQFSGVDRDERHILAATVNRLQARNHTVSLVRGDGVAFLNDRLKALPRNARVGLMLDGPKGLDAVRLGQQLLHDYHQVAFFAIHDVNTVESPKAEFEAIVSQADLWTGDPKWRSAFRSLDAPCNPSMFSFKYGCPMLRLQIGHGVALTAGEQLRKAAAAMRAPPNG
jgi:hypothetical protein